MKDFTSRLLNSALVVAASLTFGLTVNAQTDDPRQKIQPASGTQYLGSDSATQSNPQKMFTYDDHGNTIQEISGSLTKMDIKENVYSYDKPYPVLLNSYSYTQDKSGTHDTIWFVHTTVNKDGIRTGYSVSSGWSEFSNFKFDEFGHIISSVDDNDSISISWNGDIPSTYYHKSGSESYIMGITDLKNISVAYAMKPLDATGYEFDNELNNFPECGVLFNGTGHYTYTSKIYRINFDGDIVYNTTANADSTEFVQTGILNGKDTVSVQTITLLDKYGSYKWTQKQPLINSGYSKENIYTANEFGDIVKTERTEDYGDYGKYTDVTYEPVDYDGNKPLRKMYYYVQDGAKVLGTVTVYDDWFEPSTNGIKSIATTDDTATSGTLYTIDGRVVRNLTNEEIASGRISNVKSGLYIVKSGKKAHKIIVK